MTPDELRAILAKPAIAAINPGLQSPQLKPHPVGQNPPQQNRREAKGASRSRVVIESHRARLCDPDNLYVKALLDAIRYAGLIPDDSPAHIELLVRQVKAPRDAEKTVVLIEPI